MIRRFARGGALGLVLLAARAAGQEPVDPAEALIARLEDVWARQDVAGYLALWDFPDAEVRAREEEFARDHFAAEETRLTLERPGRYPAGPALVHGQAFAASEPRGRVKQLRFRLEARPGGHRLVERLEQGEIDGLVHLSLDPAGIKADGLILRLPDFELRMERGTLFLPPARLGPTAIVFVGEGRVRVTPGPASEQDQLRIFCGRTQLEEDVGRAFVRIHPADLHRVLHPVRLEADPGAANRLGEAQSFFREQAGKAFVLDAPLPRSPWWLLPSVGDALVAFRSRRGTLTYTLNSGDAEDVSLFNRDKRLQILLYASGGRDADHDEDDARAADLVAHDLSVRFEPERGFLRGEDALSLELLQPATTLRLRLDDALKVLSVSSAEGGSHLFFRVRSQDSLVVSLGPYSGRLGEVRLLVRYVGVLDPSEVEDESLQVEGAARDDDIFVEKVYLYTNKDAWYPRNVRDDHARYRVRFDVPGGYTAVSGGRLAARGAEGDRATFEYRLDEPGKYLSVAIGRLTAVGVGAAGSVTLNAFATRRQRNEAEQGLAAAREILAFFSEEFGPCPYSFVNLVFSEHVTPGGHSPPGMVLVQRRPLLATQPLRDDPANFSDQPGFFLAHELAHQWWGQGVAPKNYRERWLSEGSAQYAAALWLRKSRGEGTFRAILKRLGDWAQRSARAGPLILSYRIGHLRGDPQAYRAVVYNKGAYVLHMLRGLVGDEAMRRALGAFQARHRYTKAGTQELRVALEAESGRNLRPYFEAWVKGTELPGLRMSTQSGRASGRFRTTVRLNTEAWPGPLPVLLSVSHKEGREELRVTVEPGGGVFTVDTPARVQKVEANADRALLARVSGR
jgi:hypothetical protein